MTCWHDIEQGERLKDRMNRILRLSSLLLVCVLPMTAQLLAQPEQTGHDHADHQQPADTHQDHDMSQMPGMQHDHMQPERFIDEILNHATSGTSAEPNSTPLPMLMFTPNQWRLMLHGTAFVNALQQSGPRGGDKVFATGWFMFMAQRDVPHGELTLRAMLSPEPLTVTNRFYPELFQQGETAFGQPIADGQHPHDFLMEIAALYDLKLGKNALLSFYAAPVGDPAIGPSAYAHRTSASENPMATLGHHMQDSTHIADDVVTMGLTYRAVRVEASGFHGREPDEFRWNLDQGRIDSWSTRLTVQPRQNWSAQYSFAHLTSPEAQNPRADVRRMTASVMHNYPFRNGNVATTLLWGRNRELSSGAVFNGYLAESTVRFAQSNYLWGRIENADRTTELLSGAPGIVLPAGEGFLARVQASSLGYGKEFHWIPYFQTELGGQVTFYRKPDFLTPIYGHHPTGLTLFLRMRLANPIG